MKEKFIEGKTYKLPGALTPFQEEMYVHLINWKWGKNIKEPGIYQKKDKRGIVQTYEYDAILPKSIHKKRFIIIRNIPIFPAFKTMMKTAIFV